MESLQNCENPGSVQAFIQRLAPLCRVGRFCASYTVLERFRSHDFNGAMIRGAFGTVLHNLNPQLYASLFDAPTSFCEARGYRLRRVAGQRMMMEPGTTFEFGFDLFGPQNDHLAQVATALEAMGWHGLGPDNAMLRLRTLWQELPNGERVALWWGKSPCLPPLHVTLDDFAMPTAGRYLLSLQSPTVFRSEGRTLCPTLDLISQGATRRLAGLAGLSLESYPHRRLRGEPLWIQERVFDRRSIRAGEQRMQGWIGAYEVQVDSAEAAAPLWAATLIGAGRHTAFGFGEVSLDPLGTPALPQKENMETYDLAG